MRTAVLSLVGEDDDAHATLLDEGLDSLGATELASKLSAELDVRVPPTFIFSYPTMERICEYMEELLGLTESAPDDTTAANDVLTGLALGDIAIVGMACVPACA